MGKLSMAFNNEDKDKFIKDWITTFMATYAAQEYGTCCSIQDWTAIEGVIYEDAKFLAEKNWDYMCSGAFVDKK
jgi:hypothetical protein